jgi:hypothetical protein
MSKTGIVLHGLVAVPAVLGVAAEMGGMRYGIPLGLVASAALFLLIVMILRVTTPRALYSPTTGNWPAGGLVHWANSLGAPACGQPVGHGDGMTHAGPPTCPQCIGMGVAGRVLANPSVFLGGKR